MKKTILMYGLVGCLAIGLFNSCTRTNDTTDLLDTDAQEAGGNYSEAQKTFSDAFDATYDATASHPGLFKMNSQETTLLTDCATVTVEDSLSATKKYLITFGNGTITDSCLGKDGRYRKGKLHISITGGKFTTVGSVVIIETDNYYVDGVRVQGTKTVTNKGAIGGADMVFDLNIKGAEGTGDYAVFTKGGKTHKWKADHRKSVYFMTGTKMIDYITHTGNGDGMVNSGKTYTVNITKALKNVHGCKWLTEGTVEITPQGRQKRVIDFGNGNCDRLATLTVGKKTYQFEMR